MLKNKFLLGLCLLTSVVFTGCEQNENDGDWDPIQITINGIQSKTIHKVPAAGGQFKIFSKNYGSLWLNSVQENDKVVWPKDNNWSDFKNINLASDWYKVQYDEAGNIVVDVQPKSEDVPSRSLKFAVECGDAFSSITLLQE